MIIPMMIEIESDDSNSIDEYSRPSYLSNRPLVEDEYRQYIFFLSDDDAVDSEIETMYGPFPDSVEVSCPSPRPILQAKQSMFNKQKEIERLNRRIEELEAKKAADIRRLRAKEDDEPSRQVASTKVSRQQNDSSLLESTREIAAERKIIDDQVKETDAMCRALEEKIAIQKNQIAMAVKESTENALKLQPMDSSLPKTEFSKPIHSSDIITIDSDSDMEVNDESSNKEDSSDNTNTIKNDVPFITEDALVEADPSRKADIEESKLLDAEIKDLQSLLVKVEEERNVHRLKLLGLKVKISINKNRKETAKNTPNQQPASPNPVLGTKRKQFMNYVPPPKRRPQMEPYSNVPPPPPQPFQHQIPPFYQQINPIPPPLPVLPHFGPPMTNYYHPLPHVDMTLTAPSTFYPLPLPPPPPPTGLPPPPSPPPPPPPEIEEIVSLPPPKSIHADIPRNRRETPYAGLNDSTATHAEDFENMSSILRDVEQLVSVRIFKVDDQTNAVAIEDRSLPRPCRLVSFNGYTMPMRTLLLEEESDDDLEWKQRNESFVLPAGLPILFEMTNKSYESPLFNILSRNAQGEQLDQSLDVIISAILLSIPYDMDLSTFHIRLSNGSSLYPERLQNTYNLVRAFRQDYPTNQFYAALTLELCLYVYGSNSPQFQLEYIECEKNLSLHVDIEWQYVLEADNTQEQMNRIKVLLQRIDKSRNSLKSDESVIASCKTAEILTRVIRLYGIDQVLKLLTGSTTINATQPSIFSLNDTTGLFLMEKDKLYVWMLILHYLITKTLPQSVCNSWMSQLVKNAEPVMSTPFFTLDWTETFRETPLDKDTLYAAINVLLSLFNHFGNRTCSDTREKPLFIGVIRTMISFLSCTPAYKIPGALLLTLEMGATSTLQPEIGEMITELQFKRDNSSLVPLKFLMDGCKTANRSQLFSLAHSMACLYNEKNPINPENCLLLACMLLIPFSQDRWSRSTLESILSEDFKTYDDTRKGNIVDSIRLKYMDLVNLGTKKQDKSLLEKNRKTAFVWINLLLLTRLTMTLRPELETGLEEKLGQVFIEGRKYLTSYDGKMIFFKYARELIKKK